MQSQTLLTTALFRLLLVASLWQGPILWGHQHQLDSMGLAFHAARCHSRDDALERGWHWHLSLPESNESQPGDDPLQPRLPVSKSAVASDAASEIDDSTLDSSVEFHALTISPRVPVASHGGFLSSFCPAHTPQQLLCRLTC